MGEWYSELGGLLGGDPFQMLLEYAGAFAGAISGVRLASAKRFDWFGAYVVGFVTALGGGTLRDLLMNMPPFWMTGPSYIVTTLLAEVAISIFGRRFISERITWFIFDTISISLFTVLGVEKALLYGFSPWCAILMGIITGVFGGVLRDIMINEVPLIFRKELYAMACFAGALLYIILYEIGAARQLSATLCVLLIFLLRALAIHYKLQVPVLTGKNKVAEWTHHKHHKIEFKMPDDEEE